MSNENQDLLDLCRLNLMEENVKDSPAPDKEITLKAIDRKKRELVMKTKPGVIAPGVMKEHVKENTVDGTYPWTKAERFQVYEKPKYNQPLKHVIIDILENDIWDISHDYGKIKRTAIVRLSKLVEHIQKDEQITTDVYELPCQGCGSTAGICDCNSR